MSTATSLARASASCAGPPTPRSPQENLAALRLWIDRSAVPRIENRDSILTDIEVIGIVRALRIPVGEFFADRRSYPFPAANDLKVAEAGRARKNQ